MTDTSPAAISFKTAYEIAFSPLGDRAAYIGRRDLTMLDLNSRQPVFAVHPIANPSQIDFSPDGRCLVVKGTSGRTVIIDSATGQLVRNFRNQEEGEGDSALFSDCGRFVVSVSWAGLFTVRNCSTAELVFSRTFEGGQLTKLSTTLDRKWFAFSVGRAPRTPSGTTPCTVVLQRWSPDAETFIEVSKEWPAIWGMQISPSGKWLAVVYGTPPNVLEIYDLANQSTVGSRPWSGGPGCAIAWSADERTLAVNRDETFELIEIPTLNTRLEVPAQYPCFVRFSPGDKHLALGSWTKSRIVATDTLVARPAIP